MALSQDLINQFTKLTSQEKENKEITVNGTYKIINGEEYVKIDGSEIWTPVVSMVEAEEGERVSVLIKNHTATVTGNITSPAARNKSVQDLKDEVDEQGNTIKQMDNTITQQGNSITQIDNNIQQIDNNIQQIDNVISQHDNVIQQIDNTIRQQGNNITQMNNKISQQGNQINQMNDTIESHGNTINQQNNTIQQQGNIIQQQGNLISQQGNQINQQQDIIESQGNTITQQGNTINQQGNTINEQGSNITILNSAFTIEDGVLKGLAAAIVNNLKTTYLNSVYADIDFTNINFAAVQKLFTESGIIKDLIVQQGKITGELVGVTIKGDLIEGNTIKADKLVVKGEDGLYYKLNIDGLDNIGTEQASKFVLTASKPSDWDTNYKDYYIISNNKYVHVTGNTSPTWQANTYYKLNSAHESGLDGTVIIAKSITADRIQVSDLVAFDATIGGFNIDTHSIYSGSKSSVDSSVSGIYLDDSGQMNVGDANSFIKRFLNTSTNKYELRISADVIVLGGSNKTMQETIDDMQQDIDDTKEDLDNMVIGGRNYIQKTSNTWSDWWYPNTSGTPQQNNTTRIKMFHMNCMDLKPNEYVTMQIEIETKDFEEVDGHTTGLWPQGSVNGKWSGTGYIQNPWHSFFRINGVNNLNKINKFTGMFKFTQAQLDDIATYGDAFELGFRCDYASSNAKVRWRCLKWEKGTKVTDWSPAPEDITASAVDLIVGTQTSTTAAWTGVANFDELLDGQQILYWLPRTSATNATLNLTLSDGSTTGAKNVYYSGTTRVGTQYPAGNAIRLTYRKNVSINGSSTLYTGWWADANYDSNNTNLLRFQQNITAETAITSGQLIAGTSNGFRPIELNVPFDLDKPVLVASSTLAANAVGNNNFMVRPDVNITKNIENWSGTQNENCYLVGTINGNTFTPKGPVFTTAKPTQESDLYYMSLGYMYTTTNMILYPEHPIFKYINGQFKNISQIAFEAKDDIDNLEIGGRNWIRNSCALYENKEFWGSTENLEYITPNQNGGIFDRPYFNFTKTLSEITQEIIINSSLSNRLSNLENDMTLSGFIRNNSDSPITVGIRVRSISDTPTVKFTIEKELPANSDWIYYSITDAIEDLTDSLLLEYIMDDNTDIDIDVCSFKLETGNRATDWTPAPEDVDNEVEKRATIEDLNTTKADLQRQINNAQLLIDSLNAMIQTLVVGENGESLMEQTDTGWVFRLKPTLDAIAQVQNNVDSTIDGVQNSGGNNLIRNSVMFAYNANGEPNDWIVTTGGTLTISSSVESLANGAISGNIFTLNDKTVKQLVRVTPGNSYTFTTRIKKDTTGTCYAKIYNTIDEYIIELDNGEGAFYEEFALQNLIPSEDYYYVEFYGSNNSNATFTDNMLSLGEFKTRWQQASGEVMNAQVNIDQNGILIKSSKYQGDYTVMSPLEFAGYSNVNGVQTKVFSLNKDTTEVEKLESRKSIQMAPIKVLPITTGTLQGWAFVPSTN